MLFGLHNQQLVTIHILIAFHVLPAVSIIGTEIGSVAIKRASRALLKESRVICDSER